MFRPDAVDSSSVNTRSSHQRSSPRALACIGEPNLRQVVSGLADCAIVGRTATLAEGSWINGSAAPYACPGVTSVQSKVHGIDPDAAGWGHPSKLPGGRIGGGCIVTLFWGHEASSIASYLDPRGPSQDPSTLMIGGQLPCISCRSGPALPTAVRRPGPLKLSSGQLVPISP